MLVVYHWGVDSIDPYSYREDVDRGEEIPAKYFEACNEPSHVYHATEEALDDVAQFVETRVTANDRQERDFTENANCH